MQRSAKTLLKWMVSRRLWKRIGAVLAILTLLFWIGPRYSVDERVNLHRPIPEGPELATWLQERESSQQVRDELEAQIRYAHEDRRKTELALVYLHGFSASHRDIAPIHEQVASKLGANLYLARLTAHGQDVDVDAFQAVTANDWLQDAVDAHRVGTRLGERVILMGHSTGATLAAWSALDQDDVAAVILFSPNFGSANPNAKYALYPWGPQILRLSLGSHREMNIENDLQRKYWTPVYHTNGVGQVFALAEYCKDEVSKGTLNCPCLCIYSNRDKVIDLGALRSTIGQLKTPATVITELPYSTGHELAGDVLAPRLNDDLESLVLSFLSQYVDETPIFLLTKPESHASKLTRR